MTEKYDITTRRKATFVNSYEYEKWWPENGWIWPSGGIASGRVCYQHSNQV